MSAGDWKSLYQASVVGDLALVQHYLREGVNPDYQHPEVLRTPLVASLLHGNRDVALYLLRQGADPNQESQFDRLTPLQAARRLGDAELEAALVALGAAEPRPSFLRRWWRLACAS